MCYPTFKMGNVKCRTLYVTFNVKLPNLHCSDSASFFYNILTNDSDGVLRGNYQSDFIMRTAFFFSWTKELIFIPDPSLKEFCFLKGESWWRCALQALGPWSGPSILVEVTWSLSCECNLTFSCYLHRSKSTNVFKCIYPLKHSLVSLRKSGLHFIVTQLASGRGLREKDPALNSANLKCI